MKEPQWLSCGKVVEIHKEFIHSEYGGVGGLRDQSLLESALGKPKNVFHYQKPDIWEICASYGFGIVKNHPFLDGNKRTGLESMLQFLEINAFHCSVSDWDNEKRLKEYTSVMVNLAKSKMSQEKLTNWLRKYGKEGKSRFSGTLTSHPK